MKSQIYHVVSIVAIIAYFVPILIVMLKKQQHITPFLLFALYWLLGGVINLIDFFPVPKPAVELVTVIYNSLDIPILLSIIHFTTAAVPIRKFTRIVVPVFTAFELVNLLVFGLKYDALKYSLGVGLILVLTVVMWEVVLYLQKIKHTGLEKGLFFIYAALLFEYGTFVIIYIFDYYLEDASNTMDNFMVYYISSLIALIIATCGFLTKGVSRRTRFL